MTVWGGTKLGVGLLSLVVASSSGASDLAFAGSVEGLEYNANTSAALVWLHGLGDEPGGWRTNLYSTLFSGSSDTGHIRLVMPAAPVGAVTANGGAETTRWFDVVKLPVLDSASDEPVEPLGLSSAIESVHAIIAELEAQGLEASRIVVGGFSQGGALATLAAASYPRALGGAVGLSAWSARRATDVSALVAGGSNMLVATLICHGEDDTTVRPGEGRALFEALRAGGNYASAIRTYEGLGHSASLPEMRDVAAFIKVRLPPYEEESRLKLEVFACDDAGNPT